MFVTLGLGVTVGAAVSVGIGFDELPGVDVTDALGADDAVSLGFSVACTLFTVIVHFFISKLPSSSTDVDTQYMSVFPDLCAFISPSSETVAILLFSEFHET